MKTGKVLNSSSDVTFEVQMNVGVYTQFCFLVCECLQTAAEGRRLERGGGLQEEKKTLMCTYANEFGNVKLA